MLDRCCGLCFVVYVEWLMQPAFWWTLSVLDMLNTQNNEYLSPNNLYTPDKFKEIIRHLYQQFLDKNLRQFLIVCYSDVKNES